MNDEVKRGIGRYWLPLTVILGIAVLGVGAVSFGAVMNHMDVVTFLWSLNTPQVTVEELQQGKLKRIILIDMRSPEEYAQDRIGQSLLVPVTDVEAGFGVKQVRAIAQTGSRGNQDQPTIVIYCTYGERSVKAYQRLEKTGLKLLVLKGGIEAWRKMIPPQKDAEILAPIMEGVR